MHATRRQDGAAAALVVGLTGDEHPVKAQRLLAELQRQPELLALGRHSRNALMQALLGNLAQRYLRQPSCDVLVTS